jgi:hypothetical protein
MTLCSFVVRYKRFGNELHLVFTLKRGTLGSFKPWYLSTRLHVTFHRNFVSIFIIIITSNLIYAI